MKLSVPIFRLKRQARLLSREKGIPLLQALDSIANQEGFPSWNVLASKHSATPAASRLFARLKPGDLVLLGARPGHGKTLLSLDLCVTAIKAGGKAWFFSLEFTPKHCACAFESIGEDMQRYADAFTFNGTDAINAEYIRKQLVQAPKSSLVVIDYLQVLDQNRASPPVSEQIESLRAFAKDREIVFVFISQIDREYENSVRPHPDARDVRLPNPLNLKLFDQACFLNNGEIRVAPMR